jgi:hypothetical protein
MSDKSATTFWNTARGNSGAESSSFFSAPSLPVRKEEVTLTFGSSKQQVGKMRNDLGFFDRLAVDRSSRDETRRIAGELIVQMLAVQKEKIIFQIGLELDADKKRLFAESMREGSRMEKEIAERSTEFERQLIDLALDQGLAGHEQKKFRLDRLDHWKSTGRLDEQSYSVERENIETWARIFGNNLNAKVEIILRNHAQQIERTLALFRERAIPGHPPG